MKKRVKAFVALALSFALVVTMVNGYDASAKKKAKKPALSITKATIYKGSKKTVTIKNVKSKKIKSLKWSTKSKKIATVKKTSKTKASIKAVKAGKTTITCSFKYSGKKYKKTVKVTVKNKPVKKPVVTEAPVVVDPTAPPVVPTATPAGPTPIPVSEQNKPNAAQVRNENLFIENFDGPEINEQLMKNCNEGDDIQFILDKTMGADNTCLKVKRGNRADGTQVGAWTGPLLNLGELKAKPGATYRVTVWATCMEMLQNPAMNEAQKEGLVLSSRVRTGTDTSDFKNIASTGTYSRSGNPNKSFKKPVNKCGTWVKLTADVVIPTAEDQQLEVYIETVGKTVDFYIDSFTVNEITGKVDSTKLPSLAEAYKGVLNLGFSGGGELLGNEVSMETMLRQIKTAEQMESTEATGSFTFGNDFKPDALLGNGKNFTEVSALSAEEQAELKAIGYTDTKVPVLNFANTDNLLKLAKKYNVRIRGHVLLWHQQTPDWFFCKNYTAASTDKATLDYVDKATMKARLHWYIKTVLEHVQSVEGGELVYAWDVVNEALEGDGVPRRANLNGDASLWAKVYGDKSTEYITDAFTFADKYAAPGVQLYYNEYNEYFTAKRDGICTLMEKVKAVITNGHEVGVGMQMHVNPSDKPEEVRKSIQAFNALGVKVQITEFDLKDKVFASDGKTIQSQLDDKAYAQRYAEYFKVFIEEKDKIETVVIWGTADEDSWLYKNNQYVTLWRTGFQPKMAFYAVLLEGLQASGQTDVYDKYKDYASHPEWYYLNDQKVGDDIE